MNSVGAASGAWAEVYNAWASLELKAGQSAAALEVAAINVTRHALNARVRLIESDGLAATPGPYDLVLCNPPYVNSDSMAALPAEYRAEPELALAGGADGMDFVRRLFADAPARIVARFNARRPQCPVQLHTIRLEYDDEKRRALAQDRRPYIFPACGHVHARAPRAARRLLASAGPADIAGKEGRPAMRSTPSSSSQVRARAPAPAVPALPDARAVRRAPSRVGARHLRRRARGRL